MKHFQLVLKTTKRLSQRYPEAVLKQMLSMPIVNEELLSDNDKMQAWCQQLRTLLVQQNHNGIEYVITVEKELDAEFYVPHIAVIQHGLSTSYPMASEFFQTKDYRNIRELGDKLTGLLQTGAYVNREDRQQAVKSFEEVFNWLMEESKRGHTIQRYKGLGEMNPDQLWETTLDPVSRRLLQVTIEDAVAADQIFTTLMGDNVEPRRDFIEKNALSVENLDI